MAEPTASADELQHAVPGRPVGTARISARTAVDEVVLHLRGMIHRGELGPGDQLPPERELAEQLGVGRITLREALRALQQDGYVVPRRGAKGGTFVTELEHAFEQWLRRMRENIGDLEDIMAFRAAVERGAVKLAATRRTDEDLQAMRDALTLVQTPAAGDLERADVRRAFRIADASFHSALARASRSPRLISAIDRTRGQLFLRADALLYEEQVVQAMRDHEAILEAIASGDGERAAELVEAHVELAMQLLRRVLDVGQP
jgi:GntR family transcriptional repressor for pyruvate dehydrogenase complex